MRKGIFALILIGAAALFSPSVTHAVGFRPGNIIDNATMSNTSTMNVVQIQAFLNSKVPTCDTNGTQSASEFGRSDLTHAQYAAMKGWQAPPYTCLKDYTEGGYTAAQLIYNAAVVKRINPQVLIVTLQKESSLVTDTWPLNSQYKSAMGYGCPDSGPNNSANCNSNYFGFANQMNWAATMFRAVLDQSPTWYSPYIVGDNLIKWNPQSSCGSANVTIENLATAALYDYTPYQPNQAALDAGWGLGDGCSSYGNRNFYLYFTSWFNYVDTVKEGVTMQTVAQPYATPAVGQSVTYSFSLTNNLAYSITLDAVGTVGRKDNPYTGANVDFGWVDAVTLTPGQTRQFSFSTIINGLSTIHSWPAINYRGYYIQYNNWGSALTSHMPNLTLSQLLTATAPTTLAGQSVTFTATIKNNEPYPINYDAVGIPVKYYDTYNYDATWVGPGVLQPGAELALSGVRSLDKAGPYTYWPSYNFGGNYTTIGTSKKMTMTEPTPNFTVSSLSLTTSSPVIGQDIGASFTVKNNLPVPIDVDAAGIVGRYGTFNGPNRDIGWQGPFHFDAGETKTFSGYSRKITEIGTHYYWIGLLYKGSYIQYSNWGSTVVSTAPSFSVSALTLTPTSPVVGQNIGASFTVKNNLTVPIDVERVGVVGRYSTFSGPNRDIGWQGPVHFDAGETKSLTGFSRTITDVGTHYYWIGVLYNGSYIQYNNWGSTVVSRSS